MKQIIEQDNNNELDTIVETEISPRIYSLVWKHFRIENEKVKCIYCLWVYIYFYIIKNILFINILNITVVLEKLKKYYRHANSNAYPITTSKFYLFYY